MIRPLVPLLAGLCSLAVAALAAPPKAAWPETDFSRHSVPLEEIGSGGVPRDGIPAIVDPRMIAVDTATGLHPREPVMTLELEGAAARAYPVRYLLWHEIVNDRIGDRPIAVTFCPLCNSGLIFEREAAGRELQFGVSGLLRFSDLVMYDRQTHSFWQQLSGEAIVGTLTGANLPVLASWMEPWAAFAERNPDGLVMAEPQGRRRAYGTNPYAGYDTSARPFLYQGEDPPHGIAPLARVVRVGGRAWPLERLAEAGVLEEAGLRLTWSPGMASALDARDIAAGRDVGAIRVQDATTGQDVVHEVVFAFAFHAFHPDGAWMVGR